MLHSRFLVFVFVAVAWIASGSKTAWTVETPSDFVAVIDGDTITVSIDGVVERVRLLYIDTPEKSDNPHDKERPEGRAASAALRGMLTAPLRLSLWGPGQRLARDRHGRYLAVVILPVGSTAQELQISGGWAPLWVMFGRAHERWRETFSAADEKARAAGVGAWSTAPEYMAARAAEVSP